jgi:hypothetical protein
MYDLLVKLKTEPIIEPAYMRITERSKCSLTCDALDSVTICAAKVMRGGSLVYCPSFKSGQNSSMRGKQRTKKKHLWNYLEEAKASGKMCYFRRGWRT